MTPGSLVTSLRQWWRPQHIYLPLPNSVRSPQNTIPSMYSKLDNDYNGKSLGRDTNSTNNSNPTRPASAFFRKSRSYTTILLFSLFFNAVMVYFTFYAFSSPVAAPRPIPSAAASDVCPAPLPNLFSIHPPSRNQPRIAAAIDSFKSKLQDYYQEKNKTGEMDSVAFAVVTPRGPLFQDFHGYLKANDSSRLVDSKSMFRIASVSKLFTALETFILRREGALNLDDPISQYLNHTVTFPGSPNSQMMDSVTIRQLLSHMSGIGRDWPNGNANTTWPKSLQGKGSPPYNGVPIPDQDTLLKAIYNEEWVAAPYTYPVYSNTGYALLGLVNCLADKLHREKLGGEEVKQLTHAQLLKRDIFKPLKFDQSVFLVSEEHESNAAVSKSRPDETTLNFGITNPAIGQISSLSDFIRLATALLDDQSHILPPIAIREWLRPLHNEWDGYTSVGMPWEIYRHKYSSGKDLKVKDKTISLYQKLGDIMSHQAGFTLIPTRSVAIVVLSTGTTSLVGDITELAVNELMPAFDTVLAEEVEKHLSGRWVRDDGSEDRGATIELEVDDGSLYASKYIIDGIDALKTLQGRPTKKMAVWSVSNDTYRLSPSFSSDDGCAPHWIGLDAFPYVNGAPVNLLRLKTSPEGDNTLSIPSLDLDLKRSS